MNKKIGKWISTKELYLVTLKQLVDIEFDVKNWKKNYIMLKKIEYAICKKNNNKYYDIFTGTKYETIYNTEQGTYGVCNSMPLIYDKRFVSLNELSEKLKELKEQSVKLQEINNFDSNNKALKKAKKIIPFPKKY